MASSLHSTRSAVWCGEDSIDPGVAHTARWTAALRCIEHDRPDALFSDPLARGFAGEAALQKWITELAQLTMKCPWGRNHIAIRSRALDDIVTEQLDDMRALKVQIVNIGAGMCSRAWRLDVPDVEVVWFEIDRPDSVQLKKRLIREQGVQPPVASFHSIGVNFNDQDASLRTALEENDFDASLPTVFVMEGFLPYLTRTEIVDLADELEDLITDDARLVITCLNESLLKEFLVPSADTLVKYPGTVEISPLFHTCWEADTKEVFEGMGWCSKFVMSREDYAAQYLDVEMLPYEFPANKSSTELIILMKRKQEHSFANFLRNLVPSC
jgi:methyltransferase (TIGR00027 family)